MRVDGKAGFPYGDTTIAVALVVIASLVGAQYQPSGWGSQPLPYVLTVAIFLPFAIRRIAPMLALTMSVSGLLIFLAVGYTAVALNFWAPVLLLYTVASLRSLMVTAVAAALLVPVLLWAAKQSGLPWYIAVGEAVGIPVIAWAMGNVGRQLQQRNQQLAVLTEQLRIEQELRTERALTEERVRIARELHDVVAHHMSVIAVQTGLAGYVFDADPPTARAAVDTIAATSREALQEMRRLLMLLRTEHEPDDTGDRSPSLNLANLPELIDRVRATGLPVTLDLDPRSVQTLPSGVQLCAYRVVQEALTNVMKHAAQSETSVVVRREPERLTVRVINGPGEDAGPGTGHGLINMRERAAIYQGTLSARPSPDGGFIVELILPIAI